MLEKKIMHDIRDTEHNLLGENGIQLTQGLFLEFSPERAIYTMASRNKTRHGKEYISVYQIYMDSTDEYEAAMRIVGNLEHWRKLCSLNWFIKGIPEQNISGLEQWRKDMKQRDASEAKRQLMSYSRNGSVPASRYLHEVSTKHATKEKEKVQETPESEASTLLEFARKLQEG